jgi:hypothetical protein
VNTKIFSMVNSFLLRPLPMRDPEQLTVLGMQLKKDPLSTSFRRDPRKDENSPSLGLPESTACGLVSQESIREWLAEITAPSPSGSSNVPRPRSEPSCRRPWHPGLHRRA